MNSEHSPLTNNGNPSTQNGAPPITGPIGGPLPPAHTPLKPHLPPPEVSAVRDEEPLPTATSHQVAGDDHSTASAAKAVAESENLSNGQATTKVDAVSEASNPTTIEQETPSTSTQQPPPAHESDARGLNGGGIAGTSDSQISHSVITPATSIDHEIRPTSTVDEETTETAPISAPGTQNPFNESEEKSMQVDAPAPPIHEEDSSKINAEQVKEETSVPTAPEPEPQSQPSIEHAVPPPTASKEEDDVEMKDIQTNGNGTNPVVESHSAAAPNPIPADISKSEAIERRSSTVAPEDGTSLPALAEADATDLTAAQIRACQNAIKGLKSRNDAALFLAPVDPVAAGVPHYFDFVKNPMDLGTVDYKLAFTAAAQKGGNKHTEKTKQGIKAGLNALTDVYKTLEDFEKDVRLIFSNCVLFNGPDHPLSQTAKLLDGVFDKQLKSIVSTNADDNGAEASAAALAAARRPSEGVAAARPKRDIHPPPPKDLPYADRPQSASGSLVKRKKSRGKMSAREVAFYDKLDKDQLKYALQAVDELHQEPAAQYAWVFFEKPGMDLDFSQAYYATIKNPISLKEIRERIVTGEYEDIDGPANDMKLLIDNCFTFNAKGTDVYIMGEKLKNAWESKLAKMPKGNPPVVDDDDDEDEDADEEYDDEDVETRILEIREQITSLQKELDRLTSGRGKGGKSKGSKKRRPSESAGGSAKKAPAAKKAKPSNEPRKSSGGGGGGNKKKSESSGGRREEEVREVTYEQKEELAAKITQLPDDRLDGALKIIAEDKPPNANEDEEIELDIDDLSPSTLYKLYRYVVRPKGKKVTTSKLSSSDGRKRGTGGVKRKNLDEEEEAARIARLQAQLNQFDQAEPTSIPNKPSTVAAGHDDLVASESSSGEEEYESESDFE